jgi:hypothetical protein
MRLLTVGCVLAALCAGLAPAQTIQDPEGWTNAKWGMTRMELERTFPQAAVYNSGGSGPTFGLPEAEIDGARVRVGFQVDDQAGLQKVFIEPDQRSSVDPSLEAPAPTVARIAQILLLAGLKEKYGEPREATAEPSFDETLLVTHQWRWSFPGTSVVLVRESHVVPADQRLDRTYLVYEKQSANAGY